MSTTVAAALAAALARGVDRLDAQLLLARVLATSRTRLIAADDRILSPAETQRWTTWLERRARGEPIAYLLGEKEFHGVLLEVSADVLVPRPETELLVDWAAERVPTTPRRDAGDRESPIRIVDLGTGSGAIALALKTLRPDAEVTATDVSTAALAVAWRNAARLGLAIEFVESSWWDGLAGRRFDVIVANPPYIAGDDPHLHALRHEPRAALTPGGDGLSALRTLAADAAAHLRPEGWLLLEHGFDQSAAVRGLLERAGLVAIETRRDLSGHERATGGRKAAD